MIDDTEVSKTHVVVLTMKDGKTERWGPMPQRLADLTKDALDKNAQNLRSTRVVEASR